MSNLEAIKEYLEKNLETALSFLGGSDYAYLGCRGEGRSFGDPICFMEFLCKEKDRIVVVEFTPTSNSPAGCIQTFIRRPRKERKGDFYNNLRIRVSHTNYYAYAFNKEESLEKYLKQLNEKLSNEYREAILGKKFKPDNSNPRVM